MNKLQLIFRYVSNAILFIVSLFYIYGAIVHVLNMLGLTGFDWLNAPLKWQVLDVVYLILDIVVAWGLFSRVNISVIAFYTAAISQVILYTVFKDWILNVPEEYVVSTDQQNYLTTLAIFHIITLLLVSLALRYPVHDKYKSNTYQLPDNAGDNNNCD